MPDFADRKPRPAPAPTRTGRPLRVSRRHDPAEREAERVADAVVSGRKPGPTGSGASLAASVEDTVLRQPTEKTDPHESGPVAEGQEATVMRRVASEAAGGGEVDQDIAQAIEGVRGGGEPLPEPTRDFFEPRFGRDLSDVRIHRDATTEGVTDALDARAFTIGRDIGFGARQYVPGTREGELLLAHELTHVVQQDANSAPQLSGARKTDADLQLLRSRTVQGPYTTYVLPIGGYQDLFVQFYRPRDTTEGALLRLKAARDPRPPMEIPFPTGGVFLPELIIERLIGEKRQRFGFSFSGRPISRARLFTTVTAGRGSGRYHAIDRNNPWGPLRGNLEDPRHYAAAMITHPGGSEWYGWADEELPDEFIAEPKRFALSALGLTYGIPGREGGNEFKAVSGKSKGRTVVITPAPGIKALEKAAGQTAKMGVSMAIYAIPYVGALVLIGEVAAGRTIWGEKLSTEERIVMGLLVVLPVAASLRAATRGARAEVAASRELAASYGITQREALVLIRGAKAFTREEQAFVKQAMDAIKAGEALRPAAASRLAALLNKIGQQERLIFSGANDIEIIWTSSRYWGKTEGAVYGMRLPVNTFWQRVLKTMQTSKQEGLVIFQGEAVQLFHAHRVEGAFSGMKRLLGQHKAGFGDIIFDEAVKHGNKIVVTRAHIATSAEVRHAMPGGTAWAAARLWGRRLVIDPLVTVSVVGSGYTVARPADVIMLYRFLTEDEETE